MASPDTSNNSPDQVVFKFVDLQDRNFKPLLREESANKKLNQLLSSAQLLNQSGYVPVPGWSGRFAVGFTGNPKDLYAYVKSAQPPKMLKSDPAEAVGEFLKVVPTDLQREFKGYQDDLADQIDEAVRKSEVDGQTDTAITQRFNQELRTKISALLIEEDTKEYFKRTLTEGVNKSFEKEMTVIRDEDRELIDKFINETVKAVEQRIREDSSTLASRYYKDPANQNAKGIAELVGQYREWNQRQFDPRVAEHAAILKASQEAMVSFRDSGIDEQRAELVGKTLFAQALGAYQAYAAPRVVFDVNALLNDQPLNLSGRVGLVVVARGFPPTTGKYSESRPGLYEPRVDTPDLEVRRAEGIIKAELESQGYSEVDSSKRAAYFAISLIRDPSKIWEVVVPTMKGTKTQWGLEKSQLQKDVDALTNEAKLRGKVESLLWNSFAHTLGRHLGVFDFEYKTKQVFDFKSGTYKTKVSEEVATFKPWRMMFNTISGRYAADAVATRIEHSMGKKIEYLTKYGGYQFKGEGKEILDAKSLGSRRFSMINPASHMEGRQYSFEIEGHKFKVRANSDTYLHLQKTGFVNALGVFNRQQGQGPVSIGDLAKYRMRWEESVKFRNMFDSLREQRVLVRLLRRKKSDSEEYNPIPFIVWIGRIVGQIAKNAAFAAARSANAALGDPWGTAKVRFASWLDKTPWASRAATFLRANGPVFNLTLGKNLGSAVGLGAVGYIGVPILLPGGLPSAALGFVLGMTGRYGLLGGAAGFLMGGGGLFGVLAGAFSGRTLQVYQDLASNPGYIRWARDISLNGGNWLQRWFVNIFYKPLNFQFFRWGGFVRDPLLAPTPGQDITPRSLFRIPFKGVLFGMFLGFGLGLSWWQALLAMTGLGLGDWLFNTYIPTKWTEFKELRAANPSKATGLLARLAGNNVLQAILGNLKWLVKAGGVVGAVLGIGYGLNFGIGWHLLWYAFLGNVVGAFTHGLLAGKLLPAIGKWFFSIMPGWLQNFIRAIPFTGLGNLLFRGFAFSQVGWQGLFQKPQDAMGWLNLGAAWSGIAGLLGGLFSAAIGESILWSLGRGAAGWARYPWYRAVWQVLRSGFTGFVRGVGGAIFNVVRIVVLRVLGWLAAAAAAAVAAAGGWVIAAVVGVVAVVGAAFYVGFSNFNAVAAQGPVAIRIVPDRVSCYGTLQKQDNGRFNAKFTITVQNNTGLVTAVSPEVESVYVVNGGTTQLDKKALANGSELPITPLADKKGYLLSARGTNGDKVTFVHEVSNIDLTYDASFEEIVRIVGVTGTALPQAARGVVIPSLTYRQENGANVAIIHSGQGTLAEYSASGSCRYSIGVPQDGPPTGFPVLGTVYYGAFQTTAPLGGASSYGNHRGGELDITGPLGTQVYSTQGGRAYFKNDGRTKDYGVWVLVVGPQYSTFYAHLSEVHNAIYEAGSQGVPIQPGCVIGLRGSTGKSSGAHVHYEVRKTTSNGTEPLKIESTSDRDLFFSFIRRSSTNYMSPVEGADLAPAPRNCFGFDSYHRPY